MLLFIIKSSKIFANFINEMCTGIMIVMINFTIIYVSVISIKLIFSCTIYRQDLTQWWDKCYFGSEERMKFVPITSGKIYYYLKYHSAYQRMMIIFLLKLLSFFSTDLKFLILIGYNSL